MSTTGRSRGALDGGCACRAARPSRVKAPGLVVCMGKKSKLREQRSRERESLREGGEAEGDAPLAAEEVAPEVECEPTSGEEDVRRSADGTPVGWSVLPFLSQGANKGTPNEEDKTDDSGDSVPYIDLLSPTADPDEDAEGKGAEVTKDQILSACASTSAAVFAMSFLIRSLTANKPSFLGDDPELVQSLLSLQPQWDLTHILVAVGAAGLVTGARVALLRVWSDFAVATNRSNKQVLSPLGTWEVLLVSCLPGISEELLFRGSLIPALTADWRGALASGVAFGVLHNSGGRNWSFAAWASAVGFLYGMAFLATQDIYVPIAAHSLANLLSAVLWMEQNERNV
ncbi:unnamed protein product [Ostreobium quekettii]|uniref:CAAX prenyl protease 2/Lysostaphin resistance protein A-like domain-containing protein n=1 Tax=Ostreobium quekettii TaxID=121088 RepID=A0A8S1IMF8_9CHLO|nr:unnamed protein product [Ostreobium quekettii]|eukprot:evm.model.scf_11.17 EVM.evm.TU.scf_11.17   scf_11:177260-179877(-)